MDYDELDNIEKNIYNETLELIRQKRQELWIEVHELNFLPVFRKEWKEAGKRVFKEIFGSLDWYNEFFNY